MRDRKVKERRITNNAPKTIPDFFGSLQYTNSLTLGGNFSGWNQFRGQAIDDKLGIDSRLC
jgi:hypothetical protein